MPSRLSSLLVRDGLVGVKRMEKAFQRQVIYGGSLDTILLEMSLMPEERLTQYLALASGLPPAARDEARAVTPGALALLSAELALQFRAVPIAIEGEAVRVLVCAPLEVTELEDLADLLDRPLQPLITPEYRWHLAFASAYGAEAPARFTTLARTLEIETAPEPVGRTKSVIIDGSAEAAAAAALAAEAAAGIAAGVIVPTASTRPFMPMEPRMPAAPRGVPDPVPSDSPTLRMPAPPAFEQRHQRTTLIGLTPAGAQSPPTAPPAPVGVSSVASPVSAVAPSSPLAALDDFIPTTVPSAPAAPVAPIAAIDSNGVPLPVDDSDRRRISQPIPTAGRDSPLPIVHARELLATAGDRDTVFLTLLRATRARARYAGLLTVQGGAAIGRVALAEPGIDTAQIARVLVPLDAVSPFRSVVASHQPHIGSLASADLGVDAMTSRFGGPMPPSALLMPIVLRERVVAIVVAHRGLSDLKLVDVAELLPLASAAADALGRLIVKHKSAARTAGDSAPTHEPEGPVTGRFRRNGNDWNAVGHDVDVDESPAEAAAQAAQMEADYAAARAEIERTVAARAQEAIAAAAAAAPPPPPAPAQPQTIDEILDAIESAPDGAAEALLAEAASRDAESLRALVRRFPGALRVDRFAVTGRSLRAGQYGGLLELVVRLGAGATELLVDKLAAPQRDLRFYATVCVAELRPHAAIVALIERIFDNDYGVRAAALEALAGYPAGELAQPMARARRALHSTDIEVVSASAAAIVALADVDAVGDLIGALERPDKGNDLARRALVALTAQDFGTSERKWRRWWEAARRRHRIEWLIDGLVHKEDPIREAAIGELRRLTGEYFGYHHDLPRKERELAAERWSGWWRETGHRRFVERETERHRPTGVLPVRGRE